MTERKNFKVSCPRCRTRTSWANNPQRPFCSEACRMVDLGRWASEEYRIPDRGAQLDETGKVIESENND